MNRDNRNKKPSAANRHQVASDSSRAKFLQARGVIWCRVWMDVRIGMSVEIISDWKGRGLDSGCLD